MNKKITRQFFAAASAILFFGAFFNSFAEKTFISVAPAGEVFAADFDPNVFAGDDETALDIFDLVNRTRRQKRLGDLGWNDELAKMARNYSKQMARENFFDHYDRDGGNVIDRARASRLKNWSKIGENLFFCQGIRNYSAFAVKGWLESPSHRRNMLDREWTETGIGVARSRSGEIYVTQVFIKNR